MGKWQLLNLYFEQINTIMKTKLNDIYIWRQRKNQNTTEKKGVRNNKDFFFMEMKKK